MARDELASDGINRAGGTEEIGTDTHSRCSTNWFPYLSPDCGSGPVISLISPHEHLLIPQYIGTKALSPIHSDGIVVHHYVHFATVPKEMVVAIAVNRSIYKST
jgi:hypothetical protein